MSHRSMALLGAVCLLLPPLAHAQEPSGRDLTSPPGDKPPEEPPVEVRLGFVANVYAVTVQQARSYQHLFDEVPAGGGRPFRAQVASGSSGEVLSWLDSGRIDVAVLSPTMYAELLRVDPSGRPLHPGCRYLATEGMPPAPDYEWVSSDRKQKGQCHFSYRVVCLVPRESDVNSFADLKKAFEGGDSSSCSSAPCRRRVTSHPATPCWRRRASASRRTRSATPARTWFLLKSSRNGKRATTARCPSRSCSTRRRCQGLSGTGPRRRSRG